MAKVQAAFMGSESGGTGKLFFHGQVYPFTVGSLGIGGVGVSTIEAEGNVYNLSDVAQFSGAYAQGRYGIAVGTTSAGDLWLKNANDVVLDLKACTRQAGPTKREPRCTRDSDVWQLLR